MALSLTDRLRGIVSGDAREAPRRSRRAGDPAASPGLSAEARSAKADTAAGILGGEWISRAEGRVLIVDRVYARSDRHGREGIEDLVETLTAGADALAVLGRAWPGRGGCQETRQPQLLFLDLETTGLAGGAGTQAFLVGCALVEDDGIRVRQFVLPGLEHERALLAEVAAWTQQHGACHAEARGRDSERRLVTFNGRTFDLPLIETRYLFHRLDFPLAGVPHLDMLHPARRLWAPQRGSHPNAPARWGPRGCRAGDPAKRARPAIAGPPMDPFDKLRVHGERSRTVDEDSCRLSVLERHLGGVYRVGDVPGFEIPARYFQFVRDGNVRPLEAVLEHNRLDLLSLALVTARAIRLLERGPAHTSHPWEAIGLGRIYERAGSRREAEACYLHAADRARRIGREPLARADALRRLALCRWRDGRTREAALVWEELLDVPGIPAALRHAAREALAIHYEHRAKDLRTAHMLVLDTLAEHQSEARHRAATYRLQRLERKLSARNEGGLFAALETDL